MQALYNELMNEDGLTVGEVEQTKDKLPEWKFTTVEEMNVRFEPIRQILEKNGIPFAFSGSVGALLDPDHEFGRNPSDVDIVVPSSMINVVNEVLADYLDRPLRPDTVEEAARTPYCSAALGHLKLKGEDGSAYIFGDIVADYGYRVFDHSEGKIATFLIGIDDQGNVLEPGTRVPVEPIPTAQREIGGEMVTFPFMPPAGLLLKYIVDPRKQGHLIEITRAQKVL
jgi:hypothetical protein